MAAQLHEKTEIDKNLDGMFAEGSGSGDEAEKPLSSKEGGRANRAWPP